MLPVLSSLASTLLLASPPPPPPATPDVAQEQFGAYDGNQLWPAWRNWINRQTGQLLNEAYREAGTQDGFFQTEAGPSMTSSTGYWTEFRQAGYLRLCLREAPTTCQWIYRSAQIEGQSDTFHALAVEFFDGAAIAMELSDRGIPADQLDGVDFTLFGELRASLLDQIVITRLSEDECGAVGQWRAQLENEEPLYLSGQRLQADTPPPLPIPIHIRTTIEIPVSAYFGADVTVQIEGVRNRTVMDLWGNITRDLDACTQGD